MTAKHVKSLLTEGRVMYLMPWDTLLKPLDTVHLWIRHAPTVLNQLVEMCYYPVLMQRKSHTESREKFSTSAVSIYIYIPLKIVTRSIWFNFTASPVRTVSHSLRFGTFPPGTFSILLQHSRPTDEVKGVSVCLGLCEMNGKRDSLMIMRRLVFLEYPVRAQPIACQIKAPVSMTKCSPFRSAPATVD